MGTPCTKIAYSKGNMEDHQVPTHNKVKSASQDHIIDDTELPNSPPTPIAQLSSIDELKPAFNGIVLTHELLYLHDMRMAYNDPLSPSCCTSSSDEETMNRVKIELLAMKFKSRSDNNTNDNINMNMNDDDRNNRTKMINQDDQSLSATTESITEQLNQTNYHENTNQL